MITEAGKDSAIGAGAMAMRVGPLLPLRSPTAMGVGVPLLPLLPRSPTAMAFVVLP